MIKKSMSEDECSGLENHSIFSGEGFHNIIQQLPYPVMVVDEHEQIKFSNIAAGKFFDCPPEELSSLPVIFQPLENKSFIEYSKPDGKTICAKLVVSETMWGNEKTHLVTIVDATSQSEDEIVNPIHRMWFRTIINQAQDGFSIAQDGKIIFANDQAKKIFGCPKSDNFYVICLQYAAPEERQRVRDTIEEVKKTGILPECFEFWIVRADGSRRYIQNRFSWLNYSDKEQPMQWLTIMTDITQRKLMEMALQKSEQNLRDLNKNLEARIAERTHWLENEIDKRIFTEEKLEEKRIFMNQVIDINPDLIFVKDRQGKFVLVNQAMASFYNTTADLMIGKTDTYFHPANFDIEQYTRDDLEVMNTLQEKVIDDTLDIDANGIARWSHTVKRPIIGPDGTANYILGVVSDVTEQKFNEQALKESEARARALFEQAPDAIFITTEDGSIVDINPAACLMLGYDRQELLKMKVADLAAQDKQFFNELAKREPGYEESSEAYNIHRNGHLIPVEIKTTPLVGVGGNLSLSIVRDIAERMQAKKLQSALYKISEAAGNSQDLEILFHDVHKIVEELLPAQNFSIILYDAIGDKITYPYTVSNYTYHPTPETQLNGRNGRRLINYLLRQGEPLLITRDEYQALIKKGEISDAEDSLFAWLGVPLKTVEGRIIGAMIVYTHEDGCVYTEKDKEILAFISTQIAMAIERKQSDQTLIDRMLSLTEPDGETTDIQFKDLFDINEIQQIQDAFSNATGVGSLITQINGYPITRPSNFCRLCRDVIRKTDKGLKNCMHSDAIIGKPNPLGPNMQPCLSGGLWDAGASILIGNRPVANWLIGQVLVEDYAEEQIVAYANEIGANEYEYRDALAEVPRMPLAQFERICQALTLIAHQLSKLALQNVQQAREITARKKAEGRIKQQLDQLGALRKIDMAITDNVELRTTLKVFISQVVEHLNVDAASILLYHAYNESLDYAISHGFYTEALHHTKLQIGEGYAGQAAKTRKTVYIQNINDMPDGFARSTKMANEDFVSYIGTPLIAKGEIKGVLEIFHRSLLKPSQEWLRFLEALVGQAAIAIDNATLFEALDNANIKLTLAYDDTIEGWARTLELRDMETKGHSQRVVDLVIALSKLMGVSDDDLVHIRRGALLHDIGKIGVPDSILLKPGPLTPEEWKIMRLHSTYAYDMLSKIEFLKPALDIPYYHHERWDGTGYPVGLKGEEIPLPARIFAIVDVWDAVNSNRPYHKAWPRKKAIDNLRELSGKQFDPKVVEAFFTLIGEQL